MPKKVPDGEKRTVQIAFRITDRQHETLRLAAGLERRSGVNDYVHAVVASHADRLEDSPALQPARRAQEQYDHGRASAIDLPLGRAATNLSSDEVDDRGEIGKHYPPS